MPFEISRGNVPDIEPGSYKGQLTNVEAGVQTSFGEARRWTFLVDVNGKGEELTAMTSMNTGPKSKSYLWLTALLQRAPQAGEVIEDPTGKTVLLQIERNEKGFPAIAAILPFVEPAAVEPGIPR